MVLRYYAILAAMLALFLTFACLAQLFLRAQWEQYVGLSALSTIYAFMQPSNGWLWGAKNDDMNFLRKLSGDERFLRVMIAMLVPAGVMLTLHGFIVNDLSAYAILSAVALALLAHGYFVDRRRFGNVG